MSLKTYFAARAIKRQLREAYTNIELGPVSFTPRGTPERKPDGAVSTTAAHFAAEFKTLSKKDNQRVQGGISYAPHFTGGGGPAFLTTSGPAPAFQGPHRDPGGIR
jgi:hypothetical protein